MRQLLHYYWISWEHPQTALFRLGCGVTAYDAADAIRLLEASLFKQVPLPAHTIREIAGLQELEQDHVLPNIGNIVARGVWYPALSPRF